MLARQVSCIRIIIVSPVAQKAQVTAQVQPDTAAGHTDVVQVAKIEAAPAPAVHTLADSEPIAAAGTAFPGTSALAQVHTPEESALASLAQHT